MSNVIIGIGGTGGKVIKALRSRIQQTRGEDTNHYLCLDTMGYGYFLQEIYGDSAHEQRLNTGADMSANMSADELNRIIQSLTGNTKTAIAQDEYLQFKGLQPRILADLLEDAYAHNGTYNWLRAKDFKSVFNVSDKVFQFTEGAGQYRQIGRIASYATASEIQRRLKAIEQRSRPSSGGSRGVYILCSLAGGTGSGNFIDLGVLARSVFANARQQASQGGGGGSSDSVNLLLLMNGAFDANSMAGGNSNSDMDVIAHSVLRELGRFQLAPLPKSDWVFDYPEVGRIPIGDQAIFDQVCLMDFSAESKNGEGYRRDTVYPGMAEMVDLLTAPGTGAKINLSLINQNKVIRMAQAQEDDGKDMAQAWADDQFAPFFSTFNSFRILFPKLAYQKKTQALAVQKFVERLTSDADPKASAVDVLQAAFAVSNWPSLQPLLATLFGEAKKADFRISFQDQGPDQTSTPATRYLDNNPTQVDFFMHLPLDQIVRQFEGDVVSYHRDHLGGNRWALPEPSKDVNLRSDMQKEVENLREQEFGVRTLQSIDLAPTSLTQRGGVQKVINRTIVGQKERVSNDIDSALTLLLQDPQNLNRTKKLFQDTGDVYLQALIDMLGRRLETILQESQTVRSEVQKKWVTVESFVKKGGDYRDACRDYLDGENRLFSITFKRLLSEAQLELVKFAKNRVQQWVKEMQQAVRQLKSMESDNGVYVLSNGVIASVNQQLRAWAKSDNVSLGLPGQQKGELDTSMGGFEQHLCNDLIDTALSVDLASWALGSSEGKPSLGLQYGAEGDTQPIDLVRGNAFSKLDSLASPPIVEEFNAWTLYRYLCDHVCKGNDDEMDTVAQEFTNKISSLEGSIKVDKGGKVFTEYLIAGSDPGIEVKADSQHASRLIDGFISKVNKIPLDITTMYSTQSTDELVFIRMDSGLTTKSVGRLSDCRQKYEQYIRNRSKILPLTHIFAEEENMVARETEMHQQVAAGTQRLLPNALSQIFGNELMVDLFVGLFYSGFVIPVGAGIDGLNPHYYCYGDFAKMNSLLRGNYKDQRAFIDQLEENPSKYYGDLFDLNGKADVVQTGTLSGKRIGADKPDFFTAMVRFVQRMPNADKNHANLREFPFSMQQVQQLIISLRGFWSKKDADGAFIDDLVKDLNHWSEEAKTLEGMADNVWAQTTAGDDTVEDYEYKLGVAIKESPLMKPEAVEFLHQFGSFLEKYYQKVRPVGKFKKRGR